MEVKETDFINNGEIDFKTDIKINARTSLRKANLEYEVYQFYFIDKKEKILFRGGLKDCINYTNSLFGYNDEVIE